MMTEHTSGLPHWLQLTKLDEPGLFRTSFQEHHLGNTFIRSLHGGVSGAMIELCTQKVARETLEDEDAALIIVSSSVDYLRVTKDADLYCRASIQRISRRLCVVDAVCWQDSEDIPVVRGVVTIKIERI